MWYVDSISSSKNSSLADIEKAYLQLALNDSDRDTTRFLWLKDIKKPPSKDNNWELRFCRVIWGIICASFLLAATITYHLSKINTSIAQQIARDLYVDNLVSGVSSTGEAIEFYKKTKEIFRSAAMNMCKWLSNSDKVMEQIDSIDKNSKDVESFGYSVESLNGRIMLSEFKRSKDKEFPYEKSNAKDNTRNI